VSEPGGLFPDGRPYMVTQKSRLPNGTIDVQLLTANGRRRNFLLDPDLDDDALHAEIAAALADDRRIAKGRRVGDSS
jgi:hypothetical protein